MLYCAAATDDLEISVATTLLYKHARCFILACTTSEQCSIKLIGSTKCSENPQMCYLRAGSIPEILSERHGEIGIAAIQL